MAKAEKSTRARRYKRITLWSMAIILLGAMVLPLGGYVYTGIQAAQAQASRTKTREPTTGVRSGAVKPATAP